MIKEYEKNILTLFLEKYFLLRPVADLFENRVSLTSKT